MSDITELLRKAAADFAALPPEKQEEIFREQRRSFVVAEAGFGSDKDEAEYAKAFAEGDAERLAALDKASKGRMDFARDHLKRHGL